MCVIRIICRRSIKMFYKKKICTIYWTFIFFFWFINSWLIQTATYNFIYFTTLPFFALYMCQHSTCICIYTHVWNTSVHNFGVIKFYGRKIMHIWFEPLSGKRRILFTGEGKTTEKIIRHSEKYRKTVWFLSQKFVDAQWPPGIYLYKTTR